MLKVFLNLSVDDGKGLAIEHRHRLGDDVEHNHFVVLSQQNGIGQANVAGAGNGDFHEGRYSRGFRTRTMSGISL